ncbi:MAG: hypothetical protein HY884_02500 [Deltaproteobacteria bacterium]|nr:hypothetical protein [Deltaproteobacteria bacterium]
MKKIFFTALFVLTVFAGCSNSVTYTLSEQYAQTAKMGVAVLPVEWPASIWEGGRFSAAEDKAVSYLFRTMVYEKLKTKNLRPVALETIDEAYLKAGKSSLSGKTPQELAALFNADSVLSVKITGWDKTTLGGYASLTIDASFEMHGSEGTSLWVAQYSTKESDLRLDAASVEYSVIKAHEPRIQRFVDAVFSTLPDSPARQDGYFQWLP